MGRLISPSRLLFRISTFGFCLSLVLSCGEVKRHIAPPPPPAPTPQESAEPETDTKGNTAIVLAADWQGGHGTVGMIPVDPPRTAAKNLQLTHSDAIIRSFDGLLYIVNRKGGDNIQVIDPDDFATLSQVSTGVATNPQDIAVVSPAKAYVTLYEPESNRSPEMEVDDLMIINPATGTIDRLIDLTPFTTDDGDRYARASSLLLIGDQLYVAIQDLPKNLALPPDQQGKIVRIDTKTDRIAASLDLQGRDPFTMVHSTETGKIYVGCVDFFSLGSPYGGVEVVDPLGMKSEGMILSDELLGGWVGDIEVDGNRGFVVVGLSDYSENRVFRFSLTGKVQGFSLLYRSPAYLPEIAVDGNGLLLVADRDPKVNGVVFVDPVTGDPVQEPISVGAPPASIAFVER